MDNQHKLIKGYRELSQEEIDLMNEVKDMAESMKQLHSKIYAHLRNTCTQEQCSFVYDGAQTVDKMAVSMSIGGVTTIYQDSENTLRWKAAHPYEWLSRGKDDLQDGFMKLTRAIAQPTTF
jgi:D-mannonate dehydratase